MEKFELLEKEFAEWQGLDPAKMVSCSSGTAALHMAFEALQLPKGAQCIVPDFAMIACARAVSLAGLIPKFIDVGTDLLLHSHRIEGDLLLLRSVTAVHTYGRRCNMDEIVARANMFDLKVIEDLAEAHGVIPHYETDAACWSFFKNKIIAGEEGGCVYFRNKYRADFARQLKNMGFTDKHDFTHIPRGHNYRLANSLASLVIDSLRQVNRNQEERRHIENLYNRHCPAEWKMPERDQVWVYDLRIPDMTSEVQDRVVEELNKVGISARHGFKCLSKQEEYLHKVTEVNVEADRDSREVLYLPVIPFKVTEEQVELSFKVIGEVLER